MRSPCVSPAAIYRYILTTKNNKTMGKIQGIAGYISGKIGSVVFMKGADGQTYGRTYVANPANPKTVPQLQQRSKMNLVGRISMVTPKSLLASMGMGGRKNRSMFSKNLLSACTVVLENDQYVAKVAPEAFVYARGAEVLRASAQTPVVDASQIRISLTLSDAALANKYGERIAVVVIDPEENGGKSTVQYTDVILAGTTATEISVALGLPLQNNDLVCVYRAPFVLDESGVATRTKGLYNDTTDFVAALLTSGEGFRGWGESTMVYSEVFTQA